MPDPVDINQADTATLARLPGIGEHLAARIVELRESEGPFREVDDLTAVSGISKRMLKALADQVTVAAETEEEPPAVVIPAPVPAVADDQERAPTPVTAVAEPDASEPDAPESDAPGSEAPESDGAGEKEAGPDQVASAMAHDAPRRSRPSFAAHLLAVFFGALLGAGLTLFLIAWFNGGALTFASSGRAGRLERDLAAQEQRQGALDEELTELQRQLEQARSGQATSAAAAATSQAAMEAAVTALETETAALDERLRGVAAAADNFEGFLNGMRDLLIELQGLPPTASITPTPLLTGTVESTDTPDVVLTPGGSGTPATGATVTATGAATRTPRPTATPLVAPSPTSLPAP